MKIAMFVKNLQQSGGFQKLVLRLSQELESSNNEVTVFSPIINTKNCYPDIIKTIKIKYIKDTEDNKRSKFYKIKIIFYYILLIFKFKKVDAIIFHDETSLIILNFILSKKTKKLWMLNCQFPEYLYQPVSQTNILKKIYYRLIKNGISKLDTLLTYDEFNYNLVKQYTNKSVEIIYAGADIYEKDTANKIIDKDYVKLISIGALFEYRRYEDIIESINILKKEGINCQLDIVGSTEFANDYLEHLKSLAINYDLEESIRFCGEITDFELDDKYKNADIFLFVNDALTWGISVFEAMSYKLPIIITSNIGAIDLIKDADCASIVNPKSPLEIAEALKKIINNEVSIKKMIQNYKKPLQMVSWEAYTNRLIKSIGKM